ncbi:MAG: hypothetical protein ACLUVF_10045 [Adlercreutzia sp.]
MTLAICFGGLALCGLAMVLLYGHELRRMARFLRARDGRSNSRLTTEMPGPGFADLARAVNGTLDAADQRERERAAEQRSSSATWRVCPTIAPRRVRRATSP